MDTMEALQGSKAVKLGEIQSANAIIVCRALLTAYGKAEITFEKFSRYIENVLSNTERIPVPLKITDSRGEVININNHLFAHQLLLGNFIYEALRRTPPKRKKGNIGQPQFIRKASIALVKKLKGTGHNVSRTGRRTSGGTIKTAYEYVAAIWSKVGIKGVTPAAVEKWCHTKPKSTTILENRRVTK